MAYPEPVERLIEAFRRFPGIGAVTAERLAFHVLRDPESRGLARAIERALDDAKRCALCCNVSESDPCPICALDLFRAPDRIVAARREFEKRRGEKFVYRSLIGDRPPPLDYRDERR